MECTFDVCKYYHVETYEKEQVDIEAGIWFPCKIRTNIVPLQKKNYGSVLRLLKSGLTSLFCFFVFPIKRGKLNHLYLAFLGLAIPRTTSPVRGEPALVRAAWPVCPRSLCPLLQAGCIGRGRRSIKTRSIEYIQRSNRVTPILAAHSKTATEA